jgi:hypothetical protein
MCDMLADSIVVQILPKLYEHQDAHIIVYDITVVTAEALAEHTV